MQRIFRINSVRNSELLLKDDDSLIIDFKKIPKDLIALANAEEIFDLILPDDELYPDMTAILSDNMRTVIFREAANA